MPHRTHGESLAAIVWALAASTLLPHMRTQQSGQKPKIQSKSSPQPSPRQKRTPSIRLPKNGDEPESSQAHHVHCLQYFSLHDTYLQSVSRGSPRA